MINVRIIASVILIMAIVGMVFGNQIATIFTESSKKIIGNFLVDQNSEICKELDRPVVYIFGTSSCPHCLWEDPVIKEVASKFTGLISFHENIDNIDRERGVFDKYSASGYVPLVVIGCKYYRVGSGESLGKDTESRVLTALICSLTGNEPSGVCSEVEDLINQIG
ncbi:MAG: thioredoxin family protein [Candidatus Aenigmatarchaeota archaeon]